MACRYYRTFRRPSIGQRSSMKTLLNPFANPCFLNLASTLLPQRLIYLFYNFLKYGLRLLHELPGRYSALSECFFALATDR